MLDKLFSLMASDGYARWVIHTRYETLHSAITAEVPHELADGRRILREWFPAMANLSDIHGEKTHNEIDYSNYDGIIKPLDGRSRFQSYLEHFLVQVFENDLREGNKKVAIGVSLSGSGIAGVEECRNQVAFPIFELDDALSLCRGPRNQWKEVLLNRAQKEFHDYNTMAERLRFMPPEVRRKLYPRFPINSVEVLVSYFGNLKNFIDLPLFRITPFSCAVTTSVGPKHINVCYSIEQELRSYITASGDMTPNWKSSTSRYKVVQE